MGEIEKVRLSLARRLSALLVSLSLLPLLLGGSLAVLTTYQLGREEIASRQQMALQLGQALIRNYLDTLLVDLEEAGYLALENPSTMEQLLRTFCLNRADFVEFSVIDVRNGQELARFLHCTPLAKGTLTNRSAYEPFFRAQRGEVYIGDVSFVEGNDPYVRISRPIVRNGQRILVVTAIVNLKSLWEPLRDLDPGAEGYFYLVDRRGNLMAFRDLSMVRQARSLANLPPVHAILSGAELSGLQAYHGLYGKPVVGRAVWINLLPEEGDATSPWGWGLVVEMPQAVAFAVFTRISIGLGTLLFAVASASLGLAWHQARRIVEPIRALARGAYAVANGRFEHQVPVTTEDELGAVAQAFNLMTARLRDLVARLESRAEQQALLRWAVQHINSAGLDAGRVYVAIHEALSRLMPCEVIVIAWKNLERNRIELVYRVDRGVREPYAEMESSTGLTGWVLNHDVPLFIEDLAEKPDFPVVHFGSGDVVRAIIAVPLHHGEKPVGVLSVQSYQPGVYTQEHLALLEVIGAQAIMVMENIWLFESRQRQLRELQVLNTVAQAAVTATSEDELIESVTQLVGETFFPAHFGLMLVDETTQTLRFHPSYRGLTGKTDPVPLGEGITGWVAFHGRPRRVADTRKTADYIDRSEGRMLSELCVPLYASGRVLGVINAESTQENAFTEADERLLVTVAGQLATAIERLRFFDEIRDALERERRLNALAHIISSNLDEDLILKQVVSLAGELIQADTGGFALLSPQGDELQFNVAYTYQLPPGVELPPLKQGMGMAWEIFETRTSRLLSDYAAHPKAVDHFVAAGVKSFVGVPVMVGETCFGVLAMFRYRSSPPFTQRELSILESVARQTGTALSNARLLAESRQRTDELTAALARQQELDRLKSEFVQNVSHELRTPLTIVRGYAEMLTDDEAFMTSVPFLYQEALRILTRRTRMLTDLVEDITLILGAERHLQQLTPLNLLELIQAALVEFVPLAQQAGLQLQADLPPTLPRVNGVSLYLRRVLDNLLSNAIKFTPEGGTIILRACADLDWVTFEVSDTGIGIPPEQQARIFERFYQVDGSSRRRYGGVGLGLALVKELVEYHGGQVSVSSVPGKGSTFRVKLPVSGN